MKLRSTIGTLLTATAVLMSCNREAGDSGQEKHDTNDTPEGVVTLSQQQVEALGLELGTFSMRNLTTVVKTNGQLEVAPAYTADVTAIIGGNVKEIKVFHGDKVSSGQVMAVLEHPDYIILQEAFAETANRLAFLEKEFERQKQLFENHVGAGKDFQRVDSEFNMEKAKYEGLKSRLEMLNLSPEEAMKGNISKTISVRAPIKGFVEEVDIKMGTYVDARDRLFGIADNSEIHADFMVYEKDVHLLKEGQKIHFTVSNLPGEELVSTIFAIGKSFEANTRAVHIHARLDENPGNLIPGMYITGHIHTDESITCTLPDDAIVTEGTKSYIFVAEEAETEGSGIFRQMEVVTGRQDEGYTEIRLLTPLPDNTQVVLNVAYYLLAELDKEETGHHH